MVKFGKMRCNLLGNAGHWFPGHKVQPVDEETQKRGHRSGVWILDIHRPDRILVSPFLFGDKAKHRDWVYTYQGRKQIIRGQKIMRDGNQHWWDVSAEGDDYISYPEIEDWGRLLEIHRAERDDLLRILPEYQ